MLTPEGKFPIVASRAIVTLGVLVVILLISGLLFFQSSNYSLYTLGVFWLLAMAVFHFCILVVSIQIPDEGNLAAKNWAGTTEYPPLAHSGPRSHSNAP